VKEWEKLTHLKIGKLNNMKTYKKSVPMLEITRDYIRDNLEEFLYHGGIECKVHSDDRMKKFYSEDFESKKGIKAKIGYGGDIYLEKYGYPYFCHGYTNIKIHILDDATIENVKTLIDIYNDGCEYYFTLFDENGKESDSCGGFYSLDDIKAFLPDEWKEEDLEEYTKNNW
jgi:hypothetical protein